MSDRAKIYPQQLATLTVSITNTKLSLDNVPNCFYSFISKTARSSLVV